MTLSLDEIAPRYIREKRIGLTLDQSIVVARAFNPLIINVDYSRCAPEGVMLPLLLEVQGPTPASYRRREFRRVAPLSIVVTATEGGTHLIVLREVGHNRWHGSLRIEVQGELFEARRLS